MGPALPGQRTPRQGRWQITHLGSGPPRREPGLPASRARTGWPHHSVSPLCPLNEGWHDRLSKGPALPQPPPADSASCRSLTAAPSPGQPRPVLVQTSGQPGHPPRTRAGGQVAPRDGQGVCPSKRPGRGEPQGSSCTAPSVEVQLWPWPRVSPCPASEVDRELSVPDEVHPAVAGLETMEGPSPHPQRQ